MKGQNINPCKFCGRDHWKEYPYDWAEGMCIRCAKKMKNNPFNFISKHEEVSE